MTTYTLKGRITEDHRLEVEPHPSGFTVPTQARRITEDHRLEVELPSDAPAGAADRQTLQGVTR